VDVHIRLVVLNVLVVLAVVAGLVMLANLHFRGVRLPVMALGAWIAISFVGGIVLPSAVQKVRVTPNELSAEEKFIANSIEATRNALWTLQDPAAQLPRRRHAEDGGHPQQPRDGAQHPPLGL
jgi:uncharacterized membrane protein (UPF0182 family)